MGGVEPIGRVLHFAPMTYYATTARPVSQRRQRGEVGKHEILRVHHSNCDGLYGGEENLEAPAARVESASLTRQYLTC